MPGTTHLFKKIEYVTKRKVFILRSKELTFRKLHKTCLMFEAKHSKKTFWVVCFSDIAIILSHSLTSRAVWPDEWIICSTIGHLQHLKICSKGYKLLEYVQNTYQLPNKPSKMPKYVKKLVTLSKFRQIWSHWSRAFVRCFFRSGKGMKQFFCGRLLDVIGPV